MIPQMNQSSDGHDARARFLVGGDGTVRDITGPLSQPLRIEVGPGHRDGAMPNVTPEMRSTNRFWSATRLVAVLVIAGCALWAAWQWNRNHTASQFLSESRHQENAERQWPTRTASTTNSEPKSTERVWVLVLQDRESDTWRIHRLTEREWMFVLRTWPTLADQDAQTRNADAATNETSDSSDFGGCDPLGLQNAIAELAVAQPPSIVAPAPVPIVPQPVFVPPIFAPPTFQPPILPPSTAPTQQSFPLGPTTNLPVFGLPKVFADWNDINRPAVAPASTAFTVAVKKMASNFTHGVKAQAHSIESLVGFAPAHHGLETSVWDSLPAERKLETIVAAAERAKSGSGKRVLYLLSRFQAQMYDGAKHDPALKPFLEREKAPGIEELRFVLPERLTVTTVLDAIEVAKIEALLKYLNGASTGGAFNAMCRYFPLSESQAAERLVAARSFSNAIEYQLSHLSLAARSIWFQLVTIDRSRTYGAILQEPILQKEVGVIRQYESAGLITGVNSPNGWDVAVLVKTAKVPFPSEPPPPLSAPESEPPPPLTAPASDPPPPLSAPESEPTHPVSQRDASSKMVGNGVAIPSNPKQLNSNKTPSTKRTLPNGRRPLRLP